MNKFKIFLKSLFDKQFRLINKTMKVNFKLYDVVDLNTCCTKIFLPPLFRDLLNTDEQFLSFEELRELFLIRENEKHISNMESYDSSFFGDKIGK